MPRKKQSAEDAKEIVKQISKYPTAYRDENGVRLQNYRRFNEGEDYEALEQGDMVALTDNVISNIKEYRDRSLGGRPRKYENVEDFFTVVDDYFQYIREANKKDIRLIPDLEGLCAFMAISRETLNAWETTRDQRYSDAIKMVKNQIAFCKKQLALKGKIPPLVFATDFNNNHGYTQKQEVIVTPNNPLGETVNPNELKTYAAELPDDTTDE